MTSSLKNDRFLKALKREPVDRTPVWMMRQAGRYLPEYRATRAKAGDFMSLCQSPELACEVTLQPFKRYPLDAAILFSDILTIPDAMGLGLYFEEGEGPRFKSPIANASDIERLPVDVLGDLSYVFDAVSLIRKELQGSVPLIGFSGSPWTLATYMIEGRSTREFKKIKSFLYAQPEALHQLLDKLAKVVSEYLLSQIASGAQAIQIFDTWGGVLSDQAYREFSLRYMHNIVSNIKSSSKSEVKDVPIILFTKGGTQWLDEICATGCDAVGLDWSADIRQVRKKLDDTVALQGNMDPAVLRAEPRVIESEVERILSSFGKHSGTSGHVFNLGHGITPDIDPENVAVYINAVVELSAKYHS